MKTLAIIPARYGSTRFPGKPLAEIQGIPMIVRVLNQARLCQHTDEIVVATDDQRIVDVVRNAEGKVVMTSSAHPTGTDRLIEVMDLFPHYDLYLNIQGDEPFLNPDVPDKIITALKHNPDADICTPVCTIPGTEKLFSPNVVKVVRDLKNFALYFSRQAIPYMRDIPEQKNWTEHHTFLQHIGVYGFRKNALSQIRTLKTGKLESAESLEQLRWMEAGLKILTIDSLHPGIAIDTPEDLEAVNRTFPG